jgi:hypothetical protein
VAKPTLSPCDVEALQKCLKENKGDRKKVTLTQQSLEYAYCSSTYVMCGCGCRAYVQEEAASRVHSLQGHSHMAIGLKTYRNIDQLVLLLLQCEAEVLAFQTACSKPKKQ